MKHLVSLALVAGIATTTFAQPPQPKDEPPADPAFLVEALEHRGSGIRQAAAKLLRDEKVKATGPLVDAVLQSPAKPAVRAAVVLIQRLDQLRRTAGSDPPELKLTEAERNEARRLMAVVQDPRAVPWRWYLAVYLVDKLDPASLPELLPELTSALHPAQHPMKQYAAVQALYRLGDDAKDAQAALWTLLAAQRGRFHGLYVAERVLDDDAVAFTEDVGVYDVLFQLRDAFVIQDLFLLKTLRRVGAAPGHLTAALAWYSRHESQHVRLEVARQLVALDDAAKAVAADVLIGLLREYDSVLLDLLSEEDGATRKQAVDLLVGLGPAAKRAVPSLTRLLRSDTAHLRHSAATTLGRIGPPAASALPALRRALKFERLREGDDHQAFADAIDKITGEKG